MLLMLLLAAFAAGLAVFLAGEVATYPHRRREIAMRRASHYGRSRVEVKPGEVARFGERVVEPAVRKLAAITTRLNPKSTVDSISGRLMSAGVTSLVTPTQFLALKAACAIGGVVMAILFGAAVAPVAGIVFALPLAAVGFLFPDVFLTMCMRARREKIRSELPDALDLLAVSVEAGLGLDGAITKLTEHMEGPLIDEFAMALGEMRIGESRHVALRSMAERAPSKELAAFVRSVIQADQLGISLGRILRVQAADSRLRRQAAAEEQAMKAPIKMLFPTVMFIFPAMFVVVLGPALLNLQKYLAN